MGVILERQGSPRGIAIAAGLLQSAVSTRDSRKKKDRDVPGSSIRQSLQLYQPPKQ
jgi:hypothetical protein